MAQTVFITGGSRGIGAACVRAFAAAGWQVAFTYRVSREAAGALAEQTGALWRCVPTCMTIKRSAVRLARCAGTFGAPDAVVCNAGIAEQKAVSGHHGRGLAAHAGCQSAGSGAHHSRRACPDLLHRKHGSIVTISSIWGQTGASCESHYAASKAALIGLTKSLAQELGPSGIRVNCVAPGVIDTDMNAMHSGETMRGLAAETPLGRIGTADEVAQSVLYLCSERASFITGQVLGVTGGF